MSEPSGQVKEMASPSSWLVPPIVALQFLTLAPPIIRRPFTSGEMGRAVAWFPLIGTLLGGVLAALDWGLAHILATEVSTVLILAASVAATGALHLDGFLDACDGLLGGHTPEKRLEIMRDERVGAFGVAGGVLLLLLKWAALAGSSHRAVALILAPTLARWAIVLAIAFAPYARAEGLGRAMKDHVGKTQVILATALALIVVFVLGRWMGLLAIAGASLVTWLAIRFALTRIPGLTGDLYGAISELVEVTIYLLYAAQVA